MHSRRLPSAPRSRPAAPRLSPKTFGDAAVRKPRTACPASSPGWRESSKQDEDAQLPPGFTALIMACAIWDNERIRGLLSLGANPDVSTKEYPRPLVIASQDGNLEAVRDLLQAGANPNFLPGDRHSPLEVACAMGCVEVVGVLLRAGASPTAACGLGMAPIGIACLAHNTPGPVRAEIVDLLLQAGADPRATLGAPPGDDVENHGGGGGSRGGWRTGGERVIHLAAHRGVAEVIPLLVAAGEDPGRAPADVSLEEQQAGVPEPPLFTAAKMGHVGVVQALVAAGADVEATVGGVKGVEVRLVSGFDSSRGGSGSAPGLRIAATPLCFAVENGHVGVVRALVAAGADVRQWHGGRSLLQAARDTGMKEIEEVLLVAEAQCN